MVLTVINVNRFLQALLLVCVCAAAVLRADEAADVNSSVYIPKEPTVTRSESELLAQVGTLMERNPEKAAELLNKRITSRSSAALDFALAAVYIHQEDLEQAAAGYRNALEKLPEFARARMNLASVYLRLDRPAQAAAELKRVLLSGRNRAETLSLLGYAYLKDNRAVHAETAYRQAIILDPDNDDVLLGLAESLLVQERYREAASLLDNLLEKKPYDSRLWMIRSNIYITLEQTHQAIAALACAERLGVASPEAHATLGDLYLNSNQPHDALKAYEKAFTSKVPLSPARLLRAVQGFLMAEHLEQAEALLGKAALLIRDKPESFSAEQHNELRYARARFYDLKGKRDKAVSAYEGLLLKDPLNGKALIALGDLKRSEGSLEEALILYERAQRIKGKEAEALVRQSMIAVDRGNYKEAVRLLESAEVIQPDPVNARFLKQVKRLNSLRNDEKK